MIAMTSKNKYLGKKAVGKQRSIGKSLLVAVGGLVVAVMSGAVPGHDNHHGYRVQLQTRKQV